jgi:hypothetical protein
VTPVPASAVRTHPASSALLAPRFYASMHANPVSPALHALASLPAVGTNTPAPARHTPTRCFAVLATALPRADLAQLLQHAVQTPTAIRRPAKQVLVVVSEHLAETTPIAGTALGGDNGTTPGENPTQRARPLKHPRTPRKPKPIRPARPSRVRVCCGGSGGG